MKIEWKNSKKLKPEVILKKINGIMTVSAEGNVSFEGFEYHDAVAALQSMINYPESVAWLSREIFLYKAISDAARKGTLDRDKVIAELNAILNSKLTQKEQTYYLLTSISIASPLPEKVVNIGACKIKIFEGEYPKKFISRTNLVSDLAQKNFGRGVDHRPQGYSGVIVSLKSKSADWAASECLKAIDILRAVWCTAANSSMEFGADEWSPINRIRLGGVHTVHNEDGTLASDTFWYEPNFVLAHPHRVLAHSVTELRKYYKNYFSKIEKSKYSNVIKDSLLRYVRALDESDQNTALIRLWGAMEELLSPNGANYDLVTRRCSFLFKERDYHRQLLEHLREYRNANIHAGEQSETVKTLCYQLQFYFLHLIKFHLSNSKIFESLVQANEFLDLPTDQNILEMRRKLIDKAIRFTA